MSRLWFQSPKIFARKSKQFISPNKTNQPTKKHTVYGIHQDPPLKTTQPRGNLPPKTPVFRIWQKKTNGNQGTQMGAGGPCWNTGSEFWSGKGWTPRTRDVDGRCEGMVLEGSKVGKKFRKHVGLPHPIFLALMVLKKNPPSMNKYDMKQRIIYIV